MKAVAVIFLIALVAYVAYFVVSKVELVKWSLLPAYLSPVSKSPSSTIRVAGNPSRAPSAKPTPSPTPTPPPAPTPPQGFTVGDLSPFFGKVSLDSVSRASSATGGGSLTIHAESTLTGPVDVTGWKVKGNRSELVFSGSVPPVSNEPINQSALILRPGDELVAYGGFTTYRSPIANVRLNKCTGYLNGEYHLQPSVPENCPRYTSGEFATFTGACQTYLYSLRTCGTPSPEEINRLSYDGACSAFLDTLLNYDSCYRAHRSENDFLQDGWRVWFPGAIPFDVDHDRILLFDRQGLLVDEYAY